MHKNDRKANKVKDGIAAWFAVVMEAAATLETVGYCTRDEDAKRQAIGAAKYARKRAKELWSAQTWPESIAPLSIVEAKKRAIAFANCEGFTSGDFQKIAMYSFELGFSSAINEKRC